MKRLLPLLLLALSACDLHEDTELLMVLARDLDGSYRVTPKELRELTDRRRLEGALGVGYRGGMLDTSGYRRGAPLDIDWTVDTAAAIPIDEDGLILWSFYHHLASARRQLTDLGYDVEPIFPVSIAYNPASTMDFQATENAAFAPGLQTFLLFPEMIAKDVPLAANEGVVRHELGHAWFHLITVGDMDAEAPWGDDQARITALDEGFADTVATLLLDDPAFIEASLALPERDVTGDWVATEDLYATGEEDPLLDPYDPYPLGTVFASLAWDIREASSPELTLLAVHGALTIWAEEGGGPDIDRYALLLTQAANTLDHEAGDAACAGLMGRFPHVEPPGSCL